MIKVTDPCPTCDKNTLVESVFSEDERKATIHYGRLDCDFCQKFIRWLSRAEIEGRSQRIKKRLLKAINYCEICLRSDAVITEHHILPFKYYPELDDDDSNRMVVCSTCHTIIHALRKIANTDNKKVEAYEESA